MMELPLSRRPNQKAEAQHLCGPTVDFFEVMIDDLWARDTGPSFLVHSHLESHLRTVSASCPYSCCLQLVFDDPRHGLAWHRGQVGLCYPLRSCSERSTESKRKTGFHQFPLVFSIDYEGDRTGTRHLVGRRNGGAAATSSTTNSRTNREHHSQADHPYKMDLSPLSSCGYERQEEYR
jgi:hypothetical protein